MPKNDSFEAFLADVLSRVPDEKRGAVEDAFRVDDVRTEFERGYRRQSDYSRHMDELRTAREEFEAQVAEANENIRGWQEWYESAQQEMESMHTEPKSEPSNALTPDQLERALAQRDERAIRYADILTDIKIEHRDLFKEKLDTNAVVALAVKRQIPLDIAYQEYISPRVKELEKTRFEEALKKAREEGAQEFASRHNLPTMTGPSEAHALDLAPATKTLARDRIAAAVSDFNSRAHTP